MSLYIHLNINEDRIGGVTVTRDITGDDGIHEYSVFYAGTETGHRRTVRVRLLHKESDGATVLAAKALGEVQRMLQMEAVA
jgi:hypothetical protein